MVECGLIGRIRACKRGSDFILDIGHRGQCSFAEISGGVFVAEFECFVDTGRRTGRHGGATQNTRVEIHICFDGRKSAGVQNFTGMDFCDMAHGQPSCQEST